MEYTFIEMFSGIGGFRLGLERSGWKCVWSNDIDKYANKIYHIHFGYKESEDSDIRNVKTERIPKHTLLTAGFPCQSFSLAGKRKGFEDTRGTLFFEICRVIAEKKPTLLLLENVKGLLSNNRGETFFKILQSLDELGYNVEWQVLNSKYFGVPQNRERVFIIGHLRERSSRTVFPIYGTNEENKELKEVGNLYKNKSDAGRVYSSDMARTLKGNSGGLGGKTGLYMISRTKANIKQREQNRNETWTLDTAGSKQAIKVIGNITESNYDDGRIVDKEGISPTIKSNIRKSSKLLSPKIIENYRIRRLTPVECERLQGFPDGWTRWLSDSQRYKVLGNAVTVNVIEYLGKLLKECLE